MVTANAYLVGQLSLSEPLVLPEFLYLFPELHKYLANNFRLSLFEILDTTAFFGKKTNLMRTKPVDRLDLSVYLKQGACAVQN